MRLSRNRSTVAACTPKSGDQRSRTANATARTVTTAASTQYGRALPAGASYPHVFQLVGATAFVGYALALWQMFIWYRRSLSTTLKATIDGLIYALLTAGTFGWLWPH